MENTFKLIRVRLGVLKDVIKQHKFCIENNLNVPHYKDSLIKREKEYEELNKEYEELKQYCIKNEHRS